MKSLISTSSFDTDLFDEVVDNADGNQLSRNYDAPSTARLAKVFVAKTNAHHLTFCVDDVELQWLGENRRVVGATGQPGSATAGANFRLQYGTVAFMKDRWGWVQLRGLGAGGSIGNGIFTLPVGYWPNSSGWLYIDDQQLDIRDNGDITPQAGSTPIRLDNVRFLAAA